MKYQNNFLIVFTLCVFSACGQSVEKSDEVEATIDALYKAMVDKDEEMLRSLTADKLTYGHSSGTLEDKAQFIDALIHGVFDYISIKPEDQKIIISENVALARHTFVTEGLNDGNPVTVRIGNLMTFQKQNGEWKLLARQAYKL